MQNVKGTLIYSGNWILRPWLLTQEDGSSIDIYPYIDEMLTARNGKPAKQMYVDSETYRLAFDDTLDYVLDYESDGRALLRKSEGFGIENLGSYLPMALTVFSGRVVEITIDETGLTIRADDGEKVFGVEYHKRGNSCRVPEGAEKTVCKIGTSDCCIFLAGGPDGFACEKFSDRTSKLLLSRHFHGEMRATRVGNCRVIGREEDDTPKDDLQAPRMSLATNPGSTVIFGFPNSGHDHDIERAARYLVVGEKYTVERLHIGDACSSVYLREIPEMGFNTIQFGNVDEPVSA